MKGIAKALVPLTLAVVVAAAVVGFSSGQASRAAACDTFSDWSGTVSSGKDAAHTAEFCSEPDDDLLVALNWGNAKKDLRLVATDPDGNVFVVDGHSPQPYEVYVQAGPLPEGEWTFVVEYDGKGKVKYNLWARFD
jgi:hypothetical protein